MSNGYLTQGKWETSSAVLCYKAYLYCLLSTVNRQKMPCCASNSGFDLFYFQKNYDKIGTLIL